MSGGLGQMVQMRRLHVESAQSPNRSRSNWTISVGLGVTVTETVGLSGSTPKCVWAPALDTALAWMGIRPVTPRGACKWHFSSQRCRLHAAARHTPKTPFGERETGIDVAQLHA